MKNTIFGDRMSILERYEDNHSRKNAFTTAEMLLVLLIISFLILAIPPLMHKKFEKQLTKGDHGRYECWRDPVNGHVYAFLATTKDGILISDENVSIGDRSTLKGKDLGADGVCTFDPQKQARGAAYFSVQAVGGGAGGSFAPRAKAQIELDNASSVDKTSKQTELEKYAGETSDTQSVYLGRNGYTEAENKSWNEKILSNATMAHAKSEEPIDEDLTEEYLGDGTAVFSYNSSLQKLNAIESTKWVGNYMPDVKQFKGAGDVLFCGGHGNRGEAYHSAMYTLANDRYQLKIDYLEGQKGGAQACYYLEDGLRVYVPVAGNPDVDDPGYGFTFKFPNGVPMLIASDLNLYNSDPKPDRKKDFYLLNLLDPKFIDEETLTTPPFASAVNTEFQNLANRFAYHQGCYDALYNKNGSFSELVSDRISEFSARRKNYCNFFNGAVDDQPKADADNYLVSITLSMPRSAFNNYPSSLDRSQSDKYPAFAKPYINTFQSTINSDMSYVFDFVGLPKSHDSSTYLKQSDRYIYNDGPNTNAKNEKYTQYYSFNRNYCIPYHYPYAVRGLSDSDCVHPDKHEIMRKFMTDEAKYALDKTPDISFNPSIVKNSNNNGDIHLNASLTIKGGERGKAAPNPWSQGIDQYNPNIRASETKDADLAGIIYPNIKEMSVNPLTAKKKQFATLYFQAKDGNGVTKDFYATPFYGHADPGTDGSFCKHNNDDGSCKRVNNDRGDFKEKFKNWSLLDYFMQIDDDGNFGLRMNTDASIYLAASKIFPRKIVMHYGYRYDTPSYGFAGESGQSYSLMLTNLKYKLEIEPGKAGKRARLNTDGTKVLDSPNDVIDGSGNITEEGLSGGDTVLWMKRRGSGTYEDEEGFEHSIEYDDNHCKDDPNNEKNYCRKILTAKGGVPNIGGGVGQRLITLGDDTRCGANYSTVDSHKIKGCHDYGAADADARFSTGSGFVIIKEFDKQTRTPSALMQAYNDLDKHLQPGSGGDGGYSFIIDNSGFIKLWSGSAQCDDMLKDQGNYCKHTDFTAESIGYHDTGYDFVQYEEAPMDGTLTAKFKTTNENDSLGNAITSKSISDYRCMNHDKEYGDSTDPRWTPVNDVENRYGYCSPTDGIPGALIIVW